MGFCKRTASGKTDRTHLLSAQIAFVDMQVPYLSDILQGIIERSQLTWKVSV